MSQTSVCGADQASGQSCDPPFAAYTLGLKCLAGQPVSNWGLLRCVYTEGMDVPRQQPLAAQAGSVLWRSIACRNFRQVTQLWWDLCIRAASTAVEKGFEHIQVCMFAVDRISITNYKSCLV